MAQESNNIAAVVNTGKPPTLLDIRFKQAVLAHLAGVSSPVARDWIDSHRIIPGPISVRGKGRGGPRLFSFENALVIATMCALTENAFMTIASASKVVGDYGHGLIEALLRGEDRHYARVREGINGFAYSKIDPLMDCAARALITIRPNQIYLGMRDRCLELFPAETAEFERKLAELREKRARQ